MNDDSTTKKTPDDPIDWSALDAMTEADKLAAALADPTRSRSTRPRGRG